MKLRLLSLIIGVCWTTLACTLGSAATPTQSIAATKVAVTIQSPTVAPTIASIPTALVPVSTIPSSESTATPGPIVPIPASEIQIEGVPYKAYQISGDSFRIVCQEPCALNEQYIFAEYAGFRQALPLLIKLTGIDTLPELQPVDLHLVIDDSICRELPGGHAGMYPSTRKAYTCTDGPGYYPTIEQKIQKAALPEEQYFPLHEYMHTLFFGRISGQAGDFHDTYAEFFHDFVVPLPSFALGIVDPIGFCSYRNDNPSRGDYPGWLISELCKQNGFQLKDVALSLIELDKLVQSDKGQIDLGYTHRVPTVAQYRDILNRLLGSDTTSAFVDACWPPQLFGSNLSVPPACQSISTGATPTPIK